MGILTKQADALRRRVTRFVSARVQEPGYDSDAADADLILVNLVSRMARICESIAPPELIAESTSTSDEREVDALALTLYTQIIGSTKAWEHACDEQKQKWRALAHTALNWQWARATDRAVTA